MFETRRTLLGLVAGLALALSPVATDAAVITFGPGTIGTPVLPTAEGIFTYDTFSGGLFRDTQGNGDGFNMEGCSVCGGGVLRVVRNDVAGGTFTFDGADVAFQFNQAFNIGFEGFRLGASQGTDFFLTTADSAYTTHLSSALSGVQIDELRVTLAATSSTATVVDNIVLTPGRAPEPSTLAVLLLGLAGLGVRTRRKSS